MTNRREFIGLSVAATLAVSTPAMAVSPVPRLPRRPIPGTDEELSVDLSFDDKELLAKEQEEEDQFEELKEGVDLDDLISAGVFGLMDAIDAFDLSRGVKFETYCVPRIRGAILDVVAVALLGEEQLPLDGELLLLRVGGDHRVGVVVAVAGLSDGGFLVTNMYPASAQACPRVHVENGEYPCCVLGQRNAVSNKNLFQLVRQAGCCTNFQETLTVVPGAIGGNRQQR